jgi:AraC-like DNA-binding protein
MNHAAFQEVAEEKPQNTNGDRHRLEAFRNSGVNQFDRASVSDWSPATLTTCTRLYHKYVEPATGMRIPDAAFCSPLGDLSRWEFLEYLTRRCGVVLLGSNAPGLTQLEPFVLAPSVRGWDTPRYFAFSDAMRPMQQAIVDVGRLRQMGHPAQVVVADTAHGGTAQERSCFYFGLDYRTLPQAPWRRGTVYLYARAHLPPGFDTPEGPTNDAYPQRPIRPLARLEVDPWDWPLLGRVHGFDVDAQRERVDGGGEGFPWVGDAAVHPARHRRSLAEDVRAYVEAHFDEKLSLEALGRRGGVSAFALLRAFRAATGLSPHEHQILSRVTRARRLLRSGAAIASVAAEVGFYDQSHFHRHFQRIVGLTPGGYLRAQESVAEKSVAQ